MLLFHITKSESVMYDYMDRKKTIHRYFEDGTLSVIAVHDNNNAEKTIRLYFKNEDVFNKGFNLFSDKAAESLSLFDSDKTNVHFNLIDNLPEDIKNALRNSPMPIRFDNRSHQSLSIQKPQPKIQHQFALSKERAKRESKQLNNPLPEQPEHFGRSSTPIHHWGKSKK